MSTTEDRTRDPVSTELVLPPDASLELVADRLVGQARADGVALHCPWDDPD